MRASGSGVGCGQRGAAPFGGGRWAKRGSDLRRCDRLWCRAESSLALASWRGRCGDIQRPRGPLICARLTLTYRPRRWLPPGDDGGGGSQPSGRAAGRPQPRAADGLARPPTDGDAWEPAAVLVSRAAAQAEVRGRQPDAGAGRSRPPGSGGGPREAGGWDAPDGREDGPVTGGGADPQGDPLGAWASEDAWSTHEDARDEGGGPAADARGGEPGAAPATSYERRWAAGYRRTRTRRGSVCDTCCGPACRVCGRGGARGPHGLLTIAWVQGWWGPPGPGRRPARVRLCGGWQARAAGGAARTAGEARAAGGRRRPASQGAAVTGTRTSREHSASVVSRHGDSLAGSWPERALPPPGLQQHASGWSAAQGLA